MRTRNAKTETRLPSLDLLKGFEAAARLLSFTLAGKALFLTQSAVSRQVQELEEQLGVKLFERKHRALVLTEAGQTFYVAAAQILATARAATERIRALSGRGVLSVSTTPSFASLWLIPRLAGFARTHSGVDVRIIADIRLQDLAREGIDVALRYCTPELAGAGAERLFGERVFPVCSPALLQGSQRPLREPADLAHHTLLRLDDPEGRMPWLNWRSWLEVAGVPDLKPAGRLLFSSYDQIVAAALAGHGVGLGRSPLLDQAISAGQLVAPFQRELESSRAFYVAVSPHARGRRDVEDFVAWVKSEAARGETPVAAKPRRRRSRSSAPSSRRVPAR